MHQFLCLCSLVYAFVTGGSGVVGPGPVRTEGERSERDCCKFWHEGLYDVNVFVYARGWR